MRQRERYNWATNTEGASVSGRLVNRAIEVSPSRFDSFYSLEICFGGETEPDSSYFTEESKGD